MSEREMLQRVTKALGDLSFECFGGIGTTRPSIETYNQTFSVLEEARAALAAPAAPLVGEPRQENSFHRMACDSSEASGSAIPARPTLPGEDARDAARYRWLREDPPVSLAVRRFPGETERGCYLDGPCLDEAIDAAMKGQK